MFGSIKEFNDVVKKKKEQLELPRDDLKMKSRRNSFVSQSDFSNTMRMNT